ERRNRTLVEAARTMLIFSHAPLFLWVEAIATACFTQNHSIIHRQFNKTPYELINGRKPDISFLHVFGALCYPNNDREDIGKLGSKGDIGFFIGYSADSYAYRIYNLQTKKIMETMNVSFDELAAMAFEQRSSKPGLQCMTSGQISSGLDLTYAPKKQKSISSTKASSKFKAEITSSSYGFVWTNENCQYQWEMVYFGDCRRLLSLHVVERRNRTLVEAARTMLIFSHAPLFLWVEAIATACFTQNRSIIHRQFNKTPYELINGRKPDISFLHVFGALCYPNNDREDIGKLGSKGDIGFFIGYSADSYAYRIYNLQTKKIMETMNVSFDELAAMAFEQRSS
nr:retrovirus-related Pol polyprotein from transposon TNT 1-94 [Tanacetum cinerariifolium]